MRSSGIRWYRAFPSALTQTVIAANNALWVGADPNAAFPYAPLTQFATFAAQQAAPVSFASVRDPAFNNGAGSDILVICGFTGNYSFATLSLTLYGNPVPGQAVVCTLVNGSTTVTVPTYTTTAADTRASIAKALVDLINASAAVIPGTPFMQQAYYGVSYPGSQNVNITFGALLAGAGGNSITVNITITPTALDGSKLAVTPLGTNNLAGGGQSISAPLKYDGNTVTGLSSQITQAFTGCVSWHSHVWYWGDPNNPDTLYASDINQPEGFSFMIQNGGYQIGAGDGDPGIRAAIPIGNILYVFKANSIYAITGYDFQSGEYQFQVQPAVKGIGTPNAQSVAQLDNSLIFWSGRAFYRLAAGAFSVENIGQPIPVTQGRISAGNQSLVSAVAGSFVAQTNLNENFVGVSPAPVQELYSSIAMFACDIGHGVADTILVYDDDATKFLGQYAWSIWTGWNVDGWIPFGKGPSSSGAPEDIALLCWIQPATTAAVGPVINAFGVSASNDSGNAIPWFAQTGWVPLETSALEKLLHAMYLEVEATSGVYFTVSITPSVLVRANGIITAYNSTVLTFGATGAANGTESHQTLELELPSKVRADAFLFGFAETSATSSYEIVNLTLDIIQEAFRP